jgi:hypothetical protein
MARMIIESAEQKQREAERQARFAQKKTSVDSVTGQTTTTISPTPEPAPIPLPYPYWSAGKEVAGGPPYLSGKPAKPAYVAPPGYVIEKTEIKEVETVGTGRTPFKQEVMQITLRPTSDREIERALIETGELKPMPSLAYSGTEFGKKTMSPMLTAYVQREQERMKQEAIIGYTIIGGVVAFPLAPVVAAKGMLIGLGLGQAFKTGEQLVTGQKLELLTPTEAVISGFGGAAFSVVGAGAMSLTTSVAARTAMIATLSGGASYVISGGKPEAALIGAGLGAGFFLGGHYIGSAISSRWGTSLSESYMEAGQKGELWKPTVTERFQSWAIGYKPLLAQEIVTAKSTPTKAGLSLADLQQAETIGEVEDYFWGKPTPRTTEMWLMKPESVSGRVRAWASEHLFVKGFMGGGLPQKAPQELLLPDLLEQPYNPQLGLPYIPTSAFITGTEVSTKISPIIPLFITSKTTPTQRIIQIQRLTLKTTPTQSLKEISIVSERAMTAQVQKQAQIAIQTQTQTQKQIQRQVQSFNIPTLLTLKEPKVSLGAFMGAGGGGDEVRSLLGLTGRWHRREHPIPTPEEITRNLLGKRRGKR